MIILSDTAGLDMVLCAHGEANKAHKNRSSIMKQIQRMTKNQWGGAMDAVNTLVKDLNSGEDTERWIFVDFKMNGGCLWIVDTIGGETDTFAKGNKHQVTVYTDGNDYFAYPWFCYDGFDGDWTGKSANGQYFTIVNDIPVIE